MGWALLGGAGVGLGEPGTGCPGAGRRGEVIMHPSCAISGSYRSSSFQPPFQGAASHPVPPSGEKPSTYAVWGGLGAP